MRSKKSLLLKNTNSAGDVDTEEKEKDISLYVRGLIEKEFRWQIKWLDWRTHDVKIDLRFVEENFAESHWILIDDENFIVYIVPREFECAGRKLKIELM